MLQPARAILASIVFPQRTRSHPYRPARLHKSRLFPLSQSFSDLPKIFIAIDRNAESLGHLAFEDIRDWRILVIVPGRKVGDPRFIGDQCLWVSHRVKDTIDIGLESSHIDL